MQQQRDGAAMPPPPRQDPSHGCCRLRAQWGRAGQPHVCVWLWGHACPACVSVAPSDGRRCHPQPGAAMAVAQPRSPLLQHPYLSLSSLRWSMFRGFRRSLRIFFFFSRSVCFLPPFFSDCGNRWSPSEGRNPPGPCSHPQPFLPAAPSAFGMLSVRSRPLLPIGTPLCSTRCCGTSLWLSPPRSRSTSSFAATPRAASHLLHVASEVQHVGESFLFPSFFFSLLPCLLFLLASSLLLPGIEVGQEWRPCGPMCTARAPACPTDGFVGGEVGHGLQGPPQP